jgi:hypothetical protein
MRPFTIFPGNVASPKFATVIPANRGKSRARAGIQEIQEKLDYRFRGKREALTYSVNSQTASLARGPRTSTSAVFLRLKVCVEATSFALSAAGSFARRIGCDESL